MAPPRPLWSIYCNVRLRGSARRKGTPGKASGGASAAGEVWTGLPFPDLRLFSCHCECGLLIQGHRGLLKALTQGCTTALVTGLGQRLQGSGKQAGAVTDGRRKVFPGERAKSQKFLRTSSRGQSQGSISDSLQESSGRGGVYLIPTLFQRKSLEHWCI